MAGKQKTLRVGLIRCDKRALWYGAIFDRIDPVAYSELDPAQYHHMTCGGLGKLKNKRAKGFKLVKVYDPDGKFECVVAGPDAFGGVEAGSSACDQCYDRVGLDIACDSQGRVFILDPASSSVRIFVRKEAAEL